MRLTTLTSGNKFSMGNLSKKVHGHAERRGGRLPAIGGTKDERYINRDLDNTKSNKRLVCNNDSRTTLNIMNVTFNSRPGVKDYIAHLIGTGTTDGEEVGLPNQLPPAGYRQNRNHGYSNFYFSSRRVTSNKQSPPRLNRDLSKLKADATYSVLNTNAGS